MMAPAYQREPWFALLDERARQPGAVRAHIAQRLGISRSALSQVLNGSGAYGSGAASTARIADRVQHTFGCYACPHLTAESGGDAHVITAEQCRAFAHRPAPTASPRDMQHWQACRQCPHREASAPPAPKEPQRRARRTVGQENGDAA